MNRIENSRFKSTGTSQAGRFFKALEADYVKIDERSFEDLLVFTSRLSRLINFYNTENQIDGDWSHYFSDETVVLATIIDSQPAKIEQRFKENVTKFNLFKRREKKQKYLQKCFEDIYSLASRFELWNSRLSEVEEFTQFQVNVRREISNAISSKLGTALQNLKFIIESSEGNEGRFFSPSNIDFIQFSEVWGLSSAKDEEGEFSRFMDYNSHNELSNSLQHIFQSFYETLIYLKSITPDYLKQSMETDIHYPEIALFLAFLKLFEHAQDNINSLTRKHINFYYHEVLKQLEKDAVFDKVFIKFKLNEQSMPKWIERGTKFIGDIPGTGKDVVYEADHDLLVNKAEVKKINTIFINQSKLNIKGRPVEIINNIYKTNLPNEIILGGAAKTGSKKSFATFGEDQSGKGKSEKTMFDADLGFAISSPNLFMSEGFREVENVFQFTPDSYKTLIDYLKDLSYFTKSDFEELFVKIFLDAFRISLTSDKGWLDIKKYVVSRVDDKCQLIVRFDLKNSDPSIVGYRQDLHKESFQAKLPVIKYILNNNAFIFPYTLLSKLILEQVWFNVKVSNLKKLLLYNNIGQLSPDSPFLPFGPMPKSGAYFILGSDEAFNKSLENLRVNIEWFDLPMHKEGFEQHYAEYNLNINNTSFEVKLSILDDGRWKPAEKEEQQTLKLFRTEDKGVTANPSPNEKILNKTVFGNIDIKNIKQAPNYPEINKGEPFTSKSHRGFVKFELINPLHGFGHDIYPSILSEVAMENAKGGLLKNVNVEKKKRLMPEKPYTPQIQSISIDYNSSSAISFSDINQKQEESGQSDGEFFYLEPFGNQKVYPSFISQDIFVLPDYKFEGALLLGFAGFNPPQQVTMLFEMIDEYTESSEEDPPVVEWSYLVNNEWYTLAPSKILRDDTNRFIKTGIITLEIPIDIEKGNTILDSDLYWIRAIVNQNISVTSNIVSLSTQVVTATLSKDNNLPIGYLSKPLPAKSIKRSIYNIPGIQSVIQPLDSFLGKSSESPEEFYTRVGERLHHKQRAVTNWDYERILLNEFPEVNKVTCLSNMTSKSVDAPGNVLLVITPHSKYSANPNEPMASSELLYKIKSHVHKYTSPFVKVEVRNPIYERIKIICAVKFTDGYNYGYYIQKLNESINQYLTGTLLSQKNAVTLGGNIHSSDILSFMRTLPYVNFITKFSMIQVARDINGRYDLIDTAREGDLKSSLQATRPWSVLVPAPEHQISVLVEKSEERSRQAGIDYLELGHDFIIEE